MPACARARPFPISTCKHLVDESLRLSKTPPKHVLFINRGLDPDAQIDPLARSRLRRASRLAPERARPLHLGGIEPSILYPVHFRHYWTTQGRAARCRRAP